MLVVIDFDFGKSMSAFVLKHKSLYNKQHHHYGYLYHIREYHTLEG